MGSILFNYNRIACSICSTYYSDEKPDLVFNASILKSIEEDVYKNVKFQILLGDPFKDKATAIGYNIYQFF